MRRPLAVFGFAFLLCMLAAVYLPAGVLPLAAGVPAALFALCLVLARRRQAGAKTAERQVKQAKWLQPTALLLAAAALACGWRLGYDALLVRPVEALAGSTRTVTARVVETEPGYGGDTMHAVLRVLEVEGDPAPGEAAAPVRAFSIKVNGLPQAQLGQLLRLRLRFYDFGANSARVYSTGKGRAVGASLASGDDAFEVLGTSHTFLTRMRQLQYAAGENILDRLPRRLAAVAAAMAVGDRRFVPQEAVEAYRAAGISHMMVVSGLHLSLLCGGVMLMLGPLKKRWPRIAALAGIASVLLLMAFTGFTPSIVRSGIAWLLVFAAPLFMRRADIYTSLGFAALALVLQNPYAAADVGLLLSFTATLGALGSGEVERALRRRRAESRVKRRARVQGENLADGAGQGTEQPDNSGKRPALPSWIRKLLRGAGSLAITSLCTTVATLPVLVFAGMGVSLFTIPMNVLAVPLLAPVVVCGLLMAIPAGLPLLGLLGAPAALVGGLLLRWLEWLTGLCAKAGWGWVPVGGLFGLVLVLVVYALALAGWKTRRALAFSLAIVVLLAGAAGLNAALNRNTVRATVAGSGANASLVVTNGGQAVVLYRSRLSAWAVQRTLRQNNVRECVLFIDLRKTAESTEYEALYHPTQIITAKDDLVGSAVYTPMDGVTVYVARQGGGTVGCVEVAGYRVGLCSGSVDLTAYAPLDVLVAGSGTVTGGYGTLVTGASVPEWADPTARLLQSDGDALIWIRPDKSVRFSEVSDGQTG